MAIPVLSNLDLNQNQAQNITIHNLSSDPGSPVEGQIWENTTSHRLKVYDGTGNRVIAVQTDSLSVFAAPSGDLSIGSHKLTNVSDPTSASDAATKGYVDSVAQGLDVHASVRAASTGSNLDLAGGDIANGQTLDGVTLATGDRVLVKDQTLPKQNGIYIVPASGAASRAADCNSSTNYITGAFTFVEQGTVNAGSSWVVSTQGTITVGTTDVTWVQFSGSGATYSAGAGLTLTGTVFSANVDGSTTYIDGSNNIAVKSSSTANQVLLSNGSSTTPTWGALPLGNSNAVSGQLAVANGGTGSATAAGARTNLGATTKFSADVGDGSSTSITVTHNLGTKDALVQVRDNNTPFDQVQVEIAYATTNTVTLVFAVAPASNRYRCIVVA